MLRVNVAAFSCYEHVRVGHAGHDQDVRGVADFVGFFVRDQTNLAAAFAPPARAEIVAGNPKPLASIDFAIFGSLGRRFENEAAGFSGGKGESRGSVFAGLAVLRGDHGLIHARVVPSVAHQIDVHRRAHGMAVVIARDDDRGDFVARLVDVAFRRDAHRERAVSGDYEIDAGDFAIGVVGDARFDAIAQVAVMFVGLRGNVHGELAVGVELARLFRSLLAIVIVVIVALRIRNRRRLLLPRRELPSSSRSM